MFGVLYDFFYTKIFEPTGGQTYARLDKFLTQAQTSFFGVSVTMREYLTFVCSLISYVFIFILCCLFVYKIIKLIGNLIK